MTMTFDEFDAQELTAIEKSILANTRAAYSAAGQALVKAYERRAWAASAANHPLVEACRRLLRYAEGAKVDTIVFEGLRDMDIALKAMKGDGDDVSQHKEMVMAKKTRPIKWPKWVPVLGESDFRDVQLGVMAERVFQNSRAANRAFCVAIRHYNGGTNKTRPRRRAAAWRKMLPDLGYTEDEWRYV